MNYDFRNTATDEKSIQLYSDLLSKVFPDTKKYTTAFIKWQYDLNPAGKVVGCDAFFNDELVGHYVTIPVIYTLKGQTIKGLLSLNTATHKEHQGKGLFTQLAQRTYVQAQQMGYKFVIGVANQNSTPGFLKKLGFTLVAPLDVKIFIGKTKCYDPEAAFFHSAWTKQLVEWRLSNPENQYYKNDACIISKTHISLISAVLSQKKYFSEFNHLNTHSSVFKMTIGHNLKKSGLLKINLPDKFKPSPLNLIIKHLAGFPDSIDSSTIYFESIDFDAY